MKKFTEIPVAYQALTLEIEGFTILADISSIDISLKQIRKFEEVSLLRGSLQLKFRETDNLLKLCEKHEDLDLNDYLNLSFEKKRDNNLFEIKNKNGLLVGKQNMSHLLKVSYLSSDSIVYTQKNCNQMIISDKSYVCINLNKKVLNVKYILKNQISLLEEKGVYLENEITYI